MGQKDLEYAAGSTRQTIQQKTGADLVIQQSLPLIE
jgi:acyl CoA:acetate/3-ketoacid CoA transferase beta subunit